MSRPSNDRAVPLVAVTGSLLLGGTSTFLVNLARAFAKRGFLLPIVNLSESNEHQADFAAAGQPVHALRRSQLIYEDRLREARRIISEYLPRAVISCLGPESFEVLRLLPSGVTRLGIVQSHEPGPYEVVERYAPWLDGVIGVSSIVERHLAAMAALKHTRSAWISYGIDFQKPAPKRENSDAPLRIIYVGRLIEEQKRVSRLVHLATSLEAAKIPVHFTIAGGGPAEAQMRAELAVFPWVAFTGAVSNADVRVLLSTSDVMVLLSDYEGLPLSLLEAMGSGVVPIVSDLESGIRDVVQSECGFRVPIGDVAAAVKIIGRLNADRLELQRCSCAAIELVRREFSADGMAERYLAFIDSFPHRSVDWQSPCRVGVPLGLNPLLYAGPGRIARRFLKRFL